MSKSSAVNPLNYYDNAVKRGGIEYGDNDLY